MALDRRKANVPEAVLIIWQVEITVFVYNKAFGGKSVHKPVSVPSPVFMLLGNDKVLKFAPEFLVIVLNPVPQVLDPLLEVEAVLLFFAKCHGYEVRPRIAKRQLGDPRFGAG